MQQDVRQLMQDHELEHVRAVAARVGVEPYDPAKLRGSRKLQHGSVICDLLIDLYEASDVYFLVPMIRYRVEDSRIRVASVHFTPIKWIEWDCLTIGALGWGQIQIADSARVVVNRHPSRQQWETQLRDALLRFYPTEINKIRGRIDFVELARQRCDER